MTVFCLCFEQPFRYVRLTLSAARPMVRLGLPGSFGGPVRA